MCCQLRSFYVVHKWTKFVHLPVSYSTLIRWSEHNKWPQDKWSDFLSTFKEDGNSFTEKFVLDGCVREASNIYQHDGQVLLVEGLNWSVSILQLSIILFIYFSMSYIPSLLFMITSWLGGLCWSVSISLTLPLWAVLSFVDEVYT